MSRKRGVGALLVYVVLWSVTGAFGATQSIFTLEGIGAIGVGDTAYEISASEAGETIRSRLEFPLDGVYVGADGRVQTGLAAFGANNITVGLKFLTNLSDPSEAMNDFDWVNDRLVGDTASDAAASSLHLDFYAKGDLILQKKLVVRGVGGLRYEQYSFDIYGLEGYYLWPLEPGPAFLPSDVLVLTYEMTHSSCYGGLEADFAVTDRLSVEGVATLGLGVVEDRDDHVLRRKVSTSEFISVSMKTAVHVVWTLTAPTADKRIYLKAGVEGYTMFADGEQDQTFEDGIPGYYAIDDEIELSFVTGNAIVGCEF